MVAAVRPAVIQHKLIEWFGSGLADWDISRDEPYFGFEIPGYPGKYYYVWLDAPIGYMATTLKYCRERGRDFDAYWRNEAATEVVHFIGKDISYFHGLFWPAMLAGAGFRSPSRLFVHGFLTINGKKMSKRRGTFITASDYRAALDPELLRYYFASKLSGGIEDLDFAAADFVQRVNSDVVNKIVNIYSRSAALMSRHPQSVSDVHVENHPIAGGSELQRRVADAYEVLDYARVVRILTAFADDVNAYFQTAEPWRSMAPGSEGARVCVASLGTFRLIMTLLSPIMPRLASSAAAAMGLPGLDWGALDAPASGIHIQDNIRLLDRIDPDVASRVVPSVED